VRSDLGVYVRAGRNPSVAILSVAQLLDDEIKRRAAIEAID
jgi:hypothetical protein